MFIILQVNQKMKLFCPLNNFVYLKMGGVSPLKNNRTNLILVKLSDHLVAPHDMSYIRGQCEVTILIFNWENVRTGMF